MHRLITLVKHARPEKLEGVDSHDWPLSPQGRADTTRLAEALRAHLYAGIISSPEPKALETATLLAQALALPAPSTHPGLGEHDRSNVPLMKTPEFVSAISLFFRKPHQLVLGKETAKQALKRIEKALDEILAQNPTGDLLILTHGTVLALWLEAYTATAPNPLDGYETWRKMGLPSYASLTWPDCDLQELKLAI